MRVIPDWRLALLLTAAAFQIRVRPRRWGRSKS